tara:strand:+ start:1502 stop:1765 length:264 start_codon:yes stop_codon:yes gene_type:complete
MYSFDKLLQLYYKTENSETFKNKYVDNLVDNINNNNIVNDENFLLDFIIINNLHYKIENYVKYIYILVPILFFNVFILGFKQFIYMI